MISLVVDLTITTQETNSQGEIQSDKQYFASQI